MRLISISLILISFVCALNTQAQKVNSRLKDLPLNSLEAFNQPASHWQIIGDVVGSYSDTILNTVKGTGILYNDYTRAIQFKHCLLYTSPSPRDRQKSRMPSSA